MDNELLLLDRLDVIRKTIEKYGEENFYLSFSGGKDSTVVHHLLDMALPSNSIPRVFINTGIEYEAIVEFVKELAKTDDRVKIIQPKKNIKKTLETVGYPFKSKEHSTKLNEWQIGHRGTKSMNKYLAKADNTKHFHFICPEILKYQFTDEFSLKVSPYCCREMKKKPAHEYQKKAKKQITITGMQRAEGGQRVHLNCIVTSRGKTIKFHPLAKVSAEWEDWFIQKHNIRLCELYYPPFNFKRTGCKGCPFALELQEQLELMEKYMPAERKQCEFIWKPVYDEYRRIGYRLTNYEQGKLF